jgi:hypothetical protein
MRHKNQFAFGFALAVATAFAPAAQAACPSTVALFLLDQSNSMNDPGMGGTLKRDLALTKMKADLAKLPSGTPVGVYGFGNSPQYDPNYTQTYIAVDPMNPQKAVVNDATIQAAFQSAHDAIVAGSWWTPLAGAACDAVQFNLTNLADGSCIAPPFGSPPGTPAPTAYQLYLYSDGIENSTPGDPGDTHPPHACAGPTSTHLFNPALEGSGFGLDPNSWQWHMANVALTGDPTQTAIPQFGIRFVWNVSLLFDTVNGLAKPAGVDSSPASVFGLQQAVTPDLQALMSGLSTATNGQYFEAKNINGVAAKIPLPGDTDPSPTRSCVEQADVSRVTQALGHRVKTGDPTFSVQDLASRDVNNDLVINTADYLLVLKYYGQCS